MDYRLKDFFEVKKIVRDGKFKSVFAIGQDFESSVAYALTRPSIRKMNSDASIDCIITFENLVNFVGGDKAIVISENPKRDLFSLHNQLVNDLKPLVEKSLIHDSAHISPTAVINENVVIKENVKIGHFSVIESGSILEKNVQIDSNVVIGARGMQSTLFDGELFDLRYAGGVIIGKNSRVLTGAVIQKPYQPYFTKVGNNTIISTHVIVGHGCKIGDRVMMSGGSGVAGNTVIENDVWIGAGAKISGGLRIGEMSEVKIGSVVINDVENKKLVSGNFAVNHKKNLRSFTKQK
jgi:UDP-3-O-[3-hydroxymyristoyl] glucosamine N-acyltransferase